MTITRRKAVLGLAAAGLLAGSPAIAQRAGVVRLVVPAAPGGAIDVIGRLYAQRMSVLLDESWIVENKSGASNTLGAAEVARAKPDGTTFLTNADIQIMSRHVLRNVSYDPVEDFTPISRFATSPMVLVGTADKTPATLPELIAQLKAEPSRHAFANSGIGAMGHLATESFKKRVGVSTLVVNYRGTAPAIGDVLAGQAQLMVAPLGSALAHIEDGKLRAFAVMGTERSARLPKVPTIGELGLEGLNFTLWYALWAPKGLAADIVQKVNGAVQRASKEPELIERLATLGAVPVTEDAAAFARFIADESKRAAQIVKEAGIEPG
jgi:tripartite-type tricarboxylate transporter receptor subunit TctC